MGAALFFWAAHIGTFCAMLISMLYICYVIILYGSEDIFLRFCRAIAVKAIASKERMSYLFTLISCTVLGDRFACVPFAFLIY